MRPHPAAYSMASDAASFTPWKSEEDWQTQLATIEREFDEIKSRFDPSELPDDLAKMSAEQARFFTQYRHWELAKYNFDISRKYEQAGVSQEDCQWHLNRAFAHPDLLDKGWDPTALAHVFGSRNTEDVEGLSRMTIIKRMMDSEGTAYFLEQDVFDELDGSQDAQARHKMITGKLLSSTGRTA
uniref:Uncharacterized protein n=1 Tax=Kwoniella dejecticola CBS 10117 TaxID=1296121 RepID=A0A1A5ZWD4_9TREE|nr:uncharacterized protein I303_08037 [Kwoniella dejecticola CBS 10117]OBR82123.1 hypothetical protein I303_08037 [Kwoniella dejecticola CBS 10117]